MLILTVSAVTLFKVASVTGSGATLISLIRKRRAIMTRVLSTRTENINNPVIGKFRKGHLTVFPENFQNRGSMHAHGELAKRRCAATTAIDNFVKQVDLHTGGFQRYDVSTSSREKKFHCSSSRMVYDLDDLRHGSWSDTIKQHHILTFVDVDYYVDFGDYATANNMLIYTLIPSALSKNGKEDSYTFGMDATNTVVLNNCIAGGAKYSHPLWDYGPDKVYLEKKTLFGLITCARTYYNVEKVRESPDSDRYFVLMAPYLRIGLPRTIIKMLQFIGGIKEKVRPLTRCSNVACVHSEVNVFVGNFSNNGVSEVQFSTCLPGAETYTLPPDVCVGLRLQANASKAGLTSHDVEYVINRYNNHVKTENPAFANTECRIISAGLKLPILNQLFSTYQHMPNVPGLITTQPVSPRAIVKFEGIVDHFMAASSSRGNDHITVHNRVLQQINLARPNANSDYWRYIDEFVENFVPDWLVASGKPNTLADTMAALSKTPAQRNRMDNIKEKSLFDLKNRVTAFQKHELTKPGSDPRNISMVETQITLLFSCYVHAFKRDVCKTHPFYIPGKSPTEIAETLSYYVDRWDGAIDSDYSRFDGTISEFLRIVERRCLERWVAKQDKSLIGTLCELDMNLSARTRHGIKYDTLGTRLSGSPMTTEGNTIVNAFLSFCAFRKLNLPPYDAFTSIGPKYGDDGLDSQLIENTILEVSKELGTKVKVNLHTDGRDLPFCGRIYVNPAVKHTSYLDLERCLGRLNVVTSLRVHALSDKINGYLVTDFNTPILSEYCRAIQRSENLSLKLSVNAYEDRDLRYKCEAGPYPQCEGEDAYCDMVDSIVRVYGISRDAIATLTRRLDGVQSSKEFRDIKSEHTQLRRFDLDVPMGDILFG